MTNNDNTTAALRIAIVGGGAAGFFAAIEAKRRQPSALVCLYEKNAKVLAQSLMDSGFDLVSGGTDNHLMLVDLTPYDLTGKVVEKLLDSAHITANKNTIPNDPQKPFVTSGIRLGTPAATSRGLKEDDFDQVAEAIAMLIKEGEPAVEKAKAIIKTLTDKYPLQPMH